MSALSGKRQRLEKHAQIGVFRSDGRINDGDCQPVLAMRATTKNSGVVFSPRTVNFFQKKSRRSNSNTGRSLIVTGA